MEKSPSEKNPNELYNLCVRENRKLSDKFWGSLPSNFSEIPSLISKDRNDFFDMKRLQDILRSYSKSLDIYSSRVEQNLQNLRNGSILTGHQPIIFGGSGLIANKISCVLFLCEYLETKGIDLAPVLMLGDYDGWQKEISRVYFPNPISSNSTLIDSLSSFPEDTVTSEIPVTSLKARKSSFDMLEKSILGFKSQLKGDKQKLYQERYAHIKTFLLSTFSHSKSLSEMFAKLWGRLLNVISDYGIIIFPTSHHLLKPYYIPTYYKFLQEKDIYVNSFTESSTLLKQEGIKPNLPIRDSSYSPFYLICKKCSLRINPQIKNLNDEFVVHGHCRNCKEVYNYSIKSQRDLAAHANFLVPRVDTSQLILQNLLGIKLRISGPGEIGYYAQVAPAIRAIGFKTPIFVKYKRLFYNTAWTEKLGKQLANRKQGTLHQRELFGILRDQVSALKQDSGNEQINNELRMDSYINEQYTSLLKTQNSADVTKYLSWQFGRFAPERYGQEVSWSWIDMALQTGLQDYIPTYIRMYSKYSVPGASTFVNTSL